MKLLVIGHSYITAFAQAKYVAMKALRRDLAVRLVIPPIVRHPFTSYRPELADGLLSEDLIVIRSLGGGSNMSYMLDPVELATLIRRFGPTHVHVEEDPHSAVGLEAAWLAHRICPDIPLSFFIWDNLNRIPRFPANMVKHRLMRFGFSRTRLVICGNQQARSLLASKGYHGPTAVIPQIGLDPINAPQFMSRPHEWPTIGCFGRLVEEKGIRDLLAALDQLRELRWRLLIRGQGPLRGEIENRWWPMFGDRLVCLDPLPHAQVQANLAGLDIFVQPSYTVARWKEQFGLTLAQAMLAGCACIGSSSGAIPEVLGGTGVLFPERDVDALAAALRRLLESPSERAILGSAAREFALARYTNEAIACRHLAAFEALAN